MNRHTLLQSPRKRALGAMAALAALALPLAGCGGGGNNVNNSGSGNLGTLVVSGTVTTLNGGTVAIPEANVTVELVNSDGSLTPEITVTSTSGTFTFYDVPSSFTNGTTTLLVSSGGTVADGGVLLQTQTVTVSTTPIAVQVPSPPAHP